MARWFRGTVARLLSWWLKWTELRLMNYFVWSKDCFDAGQKQWHFKRRWQCHMKPFSQPKVQKRKRIKWMIIDRRGLSLHLFWHPSCLSSGTFPLNKQIIEHENRLRSCLFIEFIRLLWCMQLVSLMMHSVTK